MGIKTTAKTGNQARKNKIDSEDLAQYFLTLSRFGALTVCSQRSSSEPRQKQCKINDRNFLTERQLVSSPPCLLTQNAFGPKVSRQKKETAVVLQPCCTADLSPAVFTVFTEFNPLKPELNPICYLLALLGANHFLHVSRIRVKLLTVRLLMSYIYGAPILDVSRSHTTTQHSR